jgi:ketosteroid isomerase-like protein
MNKQDFADYIACLNLSDIDSAARYYCDDAQLELGPIKLDGKKAIVDTYRRIYQQTPETLTVHQLIVDEDGVAADITFESRALVDVPDFLFGPLKKGERFSARVVALYRLKDGKFATIKVVMQGTPPSPR